MSKVFLVQHDSNSGVELGRLEVTLAEGIYQEWKKNDALLGVGHSPEYSLWVQEEHGRFEYRIDPNTEREL